MKMSKLGTLVVCLPLGLGLCLAVVACGGTDSGGNKSAGGSSAMSSGGSVTMSSGGTSSATGGSTSHAGTASTGGSSASTGGSPNPGGDFMTGLPATTPLSSLTDAQAMQVCDKIDDYFSAGLKDFDCRFAGLLAVAFSQPQPATDAAAQAACKTAYDMCEAAPSETTSMCSKPTGMCTATVGELEACANDSAAAFDQLGASFPSCADLTLKDLMDTGGGDMMEPMDPASCTTLDMKCPDAPMPPSGSMLP
jgi:hypothetical protein